MADRDRNQANLGEQSDQTNERSRVDQTNVEREDPAIDRTRREELDMEAGERNTDPTSPEGIGYPAEDGAEESDGR